MKKILATTIISKTYSEALGWLGETKVSCILHHRGVQLILAYSWSGYAILAAGKGRERDVFISLFLLCHSVSFLPYPSISSPLLYLLYSPFLWETTQNDPQELTCP